MIKIKLIGFVAFLYCFTNIAMAKDTIIWGVGHQPPRITFDGDKALGGQGGIQQKILSKELSQFYDAKYANMNWARFQTEIKSGAKICSSFLIKTKGREKDIAYSLPWHIDLPHYAVMLNSAWLELGEPQSISLKALMTHPSLKGVIETKRSYGALDLILNNSIEDNNITSISTRPVRLLSMLKKGRMDYTLEYPYFANHIFQQLNQNKDFKMLAIDESGEFYFTYVGCPNNGWGKEVIEKVNQVIKKVRPTKEYLTLLKMVYPSNQQATIDRIYHNNFINAD